MAIFNDLKKILFGAKAVSKSAAERAAETGREAGENLADRGSDLWEKAKNTAEQLGAVIREEASHAREKAEDFVEGVGGKVMMTGEVAKHKAEELGEDFGMRKKQADDDLMDAIIADAKSPQVIDNEQETLTLPPLSMPSVGEANLAEAPLETPLVFDHLQNTEAEISTEKSGNVRSKAASFAENVGAKAMETGGELAGKFGEKASQVGTVVLEKSGEALDKAKGIAENVGSQVLETGGRFAEKFGEKSEQVGSVILEKGGEAFDRAKDFAADLGDKVRRASDDLFAKAQAEAAKEADTDSLIEKAKNLNQKLEDKITGNNTRFADTTLDAGGSELNKHGGFWEKAERFAQGDYHGQPKPGELKIEDDMLELKPIKKPNEKGEGLIDDAILDDDK